MTYPWATPEIIDAAWPRFVAKVHAPDPLACWPWLGGKSRGKGNRDWYGSFYVAPGFSVRAHIFMAAAAGIHVPPGWHRDHCGCTTTLCVNLAHLDPVTPTENSLRRWLTTPTWRRPRPLTLSED